MRDAVLLNAAAALVALEPGDRARWPSSCATALRRAAESVDSGAAARALAGWVETSRGRSAAALTGVPALTSVG